LPQHTAQIFSAFAGQKRSALRLSQMGQDTKSPQCEDSPAEYAEERQKTKSRDHCTLSSNARIIFALNRNDHSKTLLSPGDLIELLTP
jgi:hypothetical protein